MRRGDKVRVMVADDHLGVRERISDLLAGEDDTVQTFETCESLLSAMELDAPELVLLDISMPAMGGFSAARHIHRKWPKTKIIFVSQHSEKPYVDEALNTGASGYVLKRLLVADLLPAIRQVREGGTFVSAQLMGK